MLVSDDTPADQVAQEVVAVVHVLQSLVEHWVDGDLQSLSVVRVQRDGSVVRREVRLGIEAPL